MSLKCSIAGTATITESAATPKTTGIMVFGRSPESTMVSRNVVRAKHARPSGAGSAIDLTDSEAISRARARLPWVGSLKSGGLAAAA